MIDNHFTAALDHPEHNLFTLGAATLDLFGAFPFVHVPRFSANETLINFNFARKLYSIVVLQAKPDAVHHVPCAFLSNSERAVNLPRANTVLHAGLHPDSYQPLVKANSRV